MLRSTAIEQAQAEYVPGDANQPLDLRQLFPTIAPLELDLGCGDGSFITSLAAEHPERNYIGVERLRGRVASACRKAAARQLSNVRILRVDIAHAAARLIPEGCVEVCHIMFPDPWPKRRHHVRRTVTVDLLRAISRLLVAGGVLRLTTDDAPYFTHMQAVTAAVPELVPVSGDGATALSRSTFENRFVQSGTPIHRLVLRNVSPVR
ncbi:MAG TPA: tRNA (guanosine(46)-N7)-methyltransferase TrmB [Chthoniobacterales bacterium]|nr:tRNA (guanosine(46)-N7)-methyltransferase TrmB [Chthoniobacterales bacterium]